MMLTSVGLIHPTAVRDPEATLAEDVQVGPYVVIEGPVDVGPGCVIEAHACLYGPIDLRRHNFVGHGVVLGKSPQHRSYQAEPTALRIGDRNTAPWHCSVIVRDGIYPPWLQSLS